MAQSRSQRKHQIHDKFLDSHGVSQNMQIMPRWKGHVPVVFLGGSPGISLQTTSAKSFEKNPRAMQEASHDPQACPDVFFFSRLGEDSRNEPTMSTTAAVRCETKTTRNSASKQLYSWHLRRSYDATAIPRWDSLPKSQPSPSSAKFLKFCLISCWFYLVISRMLLTHFPRVPFKTNQPLQSFLLNFPQKLMFTGETP